MFGLSLFHLIVPVVIVLWALNSRRYERNTRLLVERERAKAMLSLKNSQQSERDETFKTEKALIAEAKRKLLEQRAAAPAPTTPEVRPAASQPTKTSDDHKIGSSVWGQPGAIAVPSAADRHTVEMPVLPTAPKVAAHSEELVVEDVYTACDEGDSDTVH